MSDLTIWLTIGAMAVLTYLLRATFLLLHERVAFPPLISRALRYVPYAVLAALITPALFGAVDGGTLSPQPERLLAGAIGALLAWRTRSVLLTLLSGMAALWALQPVF